MSYLADANGYYGEFGGAFVPEILHRCVQELQSMYLKVLQSASFREAYERLLRDYVGRPSPLYLAHRLSHRYGCRIYLKREDLNHTGAHKINNTVGQILLARRMGKRRIIAETGAGQHGVATATVCALAGMECIVYMGRTDVERQRVNVEKMKMLGAQVVPVTSGNGTLKDATNEAIRDWCCHPADTYYIIGSTVGPHPYPDLVARLQSVISETTSLPAWAVEAMLPAASITTWTTRAYRLSWPRPEARAWRPDRPPPPLPWDAWASSTGHAPTSSRTKTDR